MKEDTVLSLKWHSFPSHLAGSLDTCYEKQQFVDLSLVCKDGTILKCHKMVLANSSSFFRRLLVANDHPHPMIILHDIEADDLKTIVNFMYCGEIQVVQSEVMRLLKLAEILEVTGLRHIQTSVLVGEMNNAGQEQIKKPIVTQRSRIDETRNSTPKGVPEQHEPLLDIRTRSQSKSLTASKFVSPIHTSRNVAKNSLEAAKRNEESNGMASGQRLETGNSGISIMNVNMPSTSRGPPNPPTLKRKDCSEQVVDWPTVLAAITKEQKLPLKRLCVMDEVEITAGKPPVQSSAPIRPKQYETLDRRKRSIIEDKRTIECEVVIKDEVDLTSETEEDLHDDPIEEGVDRENTDNIPPKHSFQYTKLENTRYSSGLPNFPPKKSSNG